MSTKTFLNSMSSTRKCCAVLLLVTVLAMNTSCAALLGYQIYDAFKGGGDDDDAASAAIENTDTYSIALGGVAPGRDELVLTDDSGKLIDFSGKVLHFEADTDTIGILPRPDCDDFAEGSGAQIIPQKPGFATISYYIDDIKQDDQFLVIVPPQSLIQMMVAEAAAQLDKEAQEDEGSHVKLSSKSPTADALGAITRNRVNFVSGGFNYTVFNVEESAWLLDPPSSYYDSVITAEGNGVYQYSPVDPTDPTNEIYENADAREFLDTSFHKAYDQAVLSAAYIFAEKTADPTNGAFAFFSPTFEEWLVIQATYKGNLIILPPDSGVSDDDFPDFAPIQILILPGISTYLDGRPAFVFIRERDITDYAVVKTP